MKIRTFAVVAVVLLAGAYAGATYHHSQASEATALAWSQKLAQSSPLIKVTSSDYKRGFLRSTQDIAIELAAPPGVGAGARGVTLRNVIYHGPLPGFTGVGIARVEHSLVFDEAAAKEVAKAFGDAPPLSAVTTVNLAGDGVTEIKGAPATYKSGDGGFAWRGLTGTVRFQKELSSYSAEIAAPGMQISAKDGGGASLDGMSVRMSQVRMADTETIYLGTMSMAVEAFSVVKDGKPQFELKRVAMSSESSSREPGFVDFAARVGAAEVRSAAFSATNAEYAFSGRHLHAKGLDQLGKAMRESQKAATAGGAQLPAAMMQALTTHGLALLQRDPVLALDRVGFVTKDGETKLTATARMVGVTEADMQNPLGLVAKVLAEGTINVPEATIASFRADAQPRLVDFAERGYVVRENGVLSTKFAFRDGQFTLNGKPFNPTGP
jgi:uncharacterized protein YdgA (DUF945 family)